jgi:Mg chelatase-related protein
VNLAPSDLKKEGTLYDFPIAVGVLAGLKLVDSRVFQGFLLAGELSLSGSLSAISGALAAALLAHDEGLKGVILPLSQAEEASYAPDISVYGVSTLRDVVSFAQATPGIPLVPFQASSAKSSVDFSSIRGQEMLKRAAEISAAGQHNFLMSGPPGSGKSMLAKALLGILPDITFDEALETTSLYSLAGLLKDKTALMSGRPFRAPHHTISYAGLVGGGTKLRPGEVVLAHNGMLFLDELPEFSRSVLEVLRQPLEEGEVTITRSSGTATFPCRFLCVAAMNPCPCGLLGHPLKACRDTPLAVDKYRGKISAPFLDRFDIQVSVPYPSTDQILSKQKVEPSATVRSRVVAAREKMLKRQQKANALLAKP